MPSVRLPAFAKVNLCLEVLGKRPDGYHELRTIFQSIGLHDTLTLTLQRRPGIELDVTGDPALAATPGRDNLVYRALAALRRELRIRSGVHIELEKQIPVRRGLGGGSSDAAAALRGMLRLTGRKLPAARLIEIAASLGADVPFFLFGGRALGVSRGDEIYPLPDLPARTVVVVAPYDIAVSTRDAYRWLGQRPSSLGLTKPRQTPRLWSFCALCWSPQGGDVSNDFEAPVFRRHPRLGRIKRGLLEQGAAEAALAGSGSAVFALFRNPAQARRAAEGFLKDQIFVCETLSREQYRRAQQMRAGA
ncbi:MAG: 4-(cytidine 5'-diphospho)-2-C-methyl-D-erythritol kinase [Acidobacteria bacterium]|nr:4-(cytidine 5'-diphospho)-2-C-methyl-D-erythritol kinase [Acidobacteriota bacterium]